LLDIRSTAGATRAVLSLQTEAIIDRATTARAIKSIMSEIRAKLSEAAQIAKAAEACLLAGSIADSVTVSLDIKRLIYEAGRLHDTASLLNRLSQE
jgi:hypothetical protein